MNSAAMNFNVQPLVELRPYQADLISQVQDKLAEGINRIVIGLVTGGGKTLISGDLAQRAIEQGYHPVFIVDRIVLAAQTVRQFETKFGLVSQLLQGSNTEYLGNPDCTIGTIQTISRRFENELHKVGIHNPFFIIDECHIIHEAHKKLLELFPDSPVIGLSATPTRKGLGLLFQDLLRGPTIEEMTNNKFLVPIVGYGPSVPFLEDVRSTVTSMGWDYDPKEAHKQMQYIMGDIVPTWKKLGQDRRTIVFAVNVAHAKEITREFEDAGISAQLVYNKTTDDQRQWIYEALKSGEIKVVVSVNVLTLGFDEPLVSCLVLARPTKNVSLHIQQLGRGLRIAPEIDKKDCIVIDHCGNCSTLGMPDAYVIPNLDTSDEYHAAPSVPSESLPTACLKCSFLKKADEIECPQCGHVNKATSNVTSLDGDLERMADGERVKTSQCPETFYRELLWWEATGVIPPMSKKPMTKGQAYHVFKNRYGIKPESRLWDNKPPIPVSQATSNELKRQRLAYFATSRSTA